VSLWECELGGVCAAGRGNNVRVTSGLLSNDAFVDLPEENEDEAEKEKEGEQKSREGNGGAGGVVAMGGGAAAAVKGGRASDDAAATADATGNPFLTDLDSVNNGSGKLAASSSSSAASSASCSHRDSGHGHSDEDDGEEGDEREWYTLGIIDILQRYNTRKKVEYVAKVYSGKTTKDQVSTRGPGPYAARFVDFLKVHTV